MASSGTFLFAPTNGQMTMQAFARIGKIRTELAVAHYEDARMELNLLFSDWANKQINQWTVVLVEQPLTAEVASYVVDPSIVELLDVYMVDPPDRIISAISRSEYAAFPDKTTSGTPTSYWFDRMIDPSLTLWMPPSADGLLKYYAVTQLEDARMPGSETPGIPYRFYDAMVAGLAHRLARIYAPSLETVRKQDAAEAWMIATNRDAEGIAVSIRPNLKGYFR